MEFKEVTIIRKEHLVTYEKYKCIVPKYYTKEDILFNLNDNFRIEMIDDKTEFLDDPEEEILSELDIPLNEIDQEIKDYYIDDFFNNPIFNSEL